MSIIWCMTITNDVKTCKKNHWKGSNSQFQCFKQAMSGALCWKPSKQGKQEKLKHELLKITLECGSYHWISSQLPQIIKKCIPTVWWILILLNSQYLQFCFWLALLHQPFLRYPNKPLFQKKIVHCLWNWTQLWSGQEGEGGAGVEVMDGTSADELLPA